MNRVKSNFFRRKIAFAWCRVIIIVLLLSAASRLALWLGPAGLPLWGPDAARAWRLGLRFDCMVAAWLATPILLLWLLTAIRPAWRKWSAGACEHWIRTVAVFVAAVVVIDFGFFCEYRDQFNVWVLGMVNDDTKAVINTIFRDYHWGRYLAAFVGLSAFTVWIAIPGLRRCFAGLGWHSHAIPQWVWWGTVLLCAGLLYRGGASRRPPQLKDVAVCGNEIANRLVVNPIYALKIAISDGWRISNSGRPPRFVRDVRAQAKLLFGARAEQARTIGELITVRNHRVTDAASPRRIYLLVMESYDMWPTRPKYSDLGLCTEIKTLARKGAEADNFLSGAASTIASLTAIMSGIIPVETAQNYRPQGNTVLPTALAPLFKRLGYRTRFVYCGYGSWQRVAEFARAQGFDELVFGNEIACDPVDRGEWGVPDGRMFDHLVAKDQGSEIPVFTLLMSASYHPPYEHDLKKLGCTEVVLPSSLASEYNGEYSMRIFSHLKYADAALGRFVRQTIAQCPESLFAITGDHWSRKFLNNAPNLDERRQVPFVLYGPKYIAAGTRLPYGSHADIAPTLLSYCAEEGFTYQTFGRSLVALDAMERSESYGNATVIHRRGGFDVDAPLVRYGELPESDAAEMLARVQASRALAWWLFEKGDDLP